jgi:hypothetical protein
MDAIYSSKKYYFWIHKHVCFLLLLETIILLLTLVRLKWDSSAYYLRSNFFLQFDQNSLAYEMRTRGNERVSVRQGYGYSCRYGTLNEANLLKTARTCCSLEA